MQSRKSFLAKIFGVLCALCCVIALSFGLAACDSDSETVKSVVGMTVENGQIVIEYSDGSTENIDLGDLKGEDGADGTNGTNGTDGDTPYIGENGNWWIGDEDTNVAATGNGIASVAFNEDGTALIITYTDGTTEEVAFPDLSDEEDTTCEHAHISWYKLEGYAYIATTDSYTGTLLEVCDDCGWAWLTHDSEHYAHQWVDVEAVEPGCSTPGHTAGQECEICGKFTGGEVIPATGNHNWSGWYFVYSENANVCEEGGWYIHICENDNCSAYELDNRTEGHFVSSLVVTTDPTATTEGAATGTCTKCGEDVTIVLPSFNDGVASGFYEYEEATCETGATYTMTIESGDVFEIDGVVVSGTTITVTYTGSEFTYTFETEAIGHLATGAGDTYTVYVGEYDVSSSTVSVRIYSSSGELLVDTDTRDNTIYSTDAWADIVKFFENVPDSCANPVQAYIQCERDSEHVLLVMYQIAHTYDEDADGNIVWYDDPTCEDDGTYQCKECGAIVTVKGSALGHNWEVTTPATCTTVGEETCSRCGATQEIRMADHSYVVVSANIDEDNDKFELDFYCKNCTTFGDESAPTHVEGVYSELLEAGIIKIVSQPDCLEQTDFVININGYELDNDDLLYAENIIIGTYYSYHIWDPASGLGYINGDYVTFVYDLETVENWIGDFVNVPPASCEQSAYAYVICAKCGGTVLIKVKGSHGQTDGYDVVKEATCGNPEIRQCRDCGNYYVYGSPVSHKLTLITDTTSSNYSIVLPENGKEGSANYICSLCDEVVNVTLPALDAVNADGTPVWTVTIDPATCENDGSATYVATFDFTYPVSFTFVDGEDVVLSGNPSVTVTVDFNTTVTLKATGHDQYVDGETLVYAWVQPEDPTGSIYVGYICTGCNTMIVLWTGTSEQYLAGNYTSVVSKVDVELDSLIPGVVFPGHDSSTEGGDTTTPDVDEDDDDETVTPDTGDTTVATDESYLVMSETGYADEDIITAGSTIYESSNLTITSTVDVKYDNSLTSNLPTLDGTELTAGFKTNDNDGSGVSVGETTGSIVITAKTDMTITVYVTICNNSYNSHRPGTVSYSVNSGVVLTAEQGNRNVLTAITVELVAGDVLTINAVASSGDNARLWFFGFDVEA